MLKHVTAALAALFFLFPLSAVGESLDLSQLGAIEEAEHWEERAWYQREDGSDWRVQDDGSVIVTLSATGDVTIGGDTRKRSQSIFDKQLAQEPLGLDFPLSNVKSIFEADDLTLVNFRGHADQHQERHEEHLLLRRAAGVCAGADLRERGGRQSGKQPRDGSRHKPGYQDTCDTLAAAGVAYSGHLGASTFTTDTGVKIGMLAYQTLNGNYKNIYASIEGDIQALRDAGCALVIVSYHWGEEKDYVPNERQVPLGRATIDAGADLVIGHHSHRMNPIEALQGQIHLLLAGQLLVRGQRQAGRHGYLHLPAALPRLSGRHGGKCGYAHHPLLHFVSGEGERFQAHAEGCGRRASPARPSRSAERPV